MREKREKKTTNTSRFFLLMWKKSRPLLLAVGKHFRSNFFSSSPIISANLCRKDFKCKHFNMVVVHEARFVCKWELSVILMSVMLARNRKQSQLQTEQNRKEKRKHVIMLSIDWLSWYRQRQWCEVWCAFLCVWNEQLRIVNMWLIGIFKCYCASHFLSRTQSTQSLALSICF